MKEKDSSCTSSLTLVKPEEKKTILEFTHIPARYNETIIKLLVRDPECVYVYWDIADDKAHQLTKEFGENILNEKFELRIVETNTQKEQFINAQFSSMNWYLKINNQEFKVLFVEMGIRLPDGRFLVIARSNIVSMPSDGVCANTNYEFKNANLVSMEALKFMLGNGFLGSSFNSCGIIRK